MTDLEAQHAKRSRSGVNRALVARLSRAVGAPGTNRREFPPTVAGVVAFLDAAAALQVRAAVPVAVYALRRHKNWRVRCAAARLLGACGRREVLSVLVEACADRSPFVRLSIVRALAGISLASRPSSRKLERGRELLATFERDTDARVRVQADFERLRLGDPAVEERLDAALRRADESLRHGIAHEARLASRLRSFAGGRRVARRLDELVACWRQRSSYERWLERTDAPGPSSLARYVRVDEPLFSVVEAVGQLGVRRYRSALRELLASHPSWHVRACAATSLGELGDVRDMSVLLKALGDRSLPVAAWAAWAVGDIAVAPCPAPEAAISRARLRARDGLDRWVRKSRCLQLRVEFGLALARLGELSALPLAVRLARSDLPDLGGVARMILESVLRSRRYLGGGATRRALNEAFDAIKLAGSKRGRRKRSR